MGCYLEGGDSVSLANVLSELLLDKQLMHKIAIESFKTYQELSELSMAKKIINKMDSYLGKGWKLKDFLYIGPKAPPVTGYANIVTALAACFLKEGAEITYISSVPTWCSRFYPGWKWKLLRLTYMIFPFCPAWWLLYPSTQKYILILMEVWLRFSMLSSFFLHDVHLKR